MLIRFHHAYHYYLVVRLRPLWIRLVNYAVDRKTGRAFFNAEKKLFGNAFHYDLLVINIFQKWNLFHLKKDSFWHNKTIESCSSSHSS